MMHRLQVLIKTGLLFLLLPPPEGCVMSVSVCLSVSVCDC